MLAVVVLCLFTGSEGWGQEKRLLIGTSSPTRLALLMELLTREALAPAGWDIEVRTLPGERSLQSANEGIIDGDGVRVDGLSARYRNLIKVPVAYYNVEMSAFTRDPNLVVKEWKDLQQPLRVGYLIGWKIYETNVTGSNVTKVSTIEALFKMLGAGRIDVALLQKLDGLAMLHQLDIRDGRVIDPPLAVMPHFLYLNARHQALVPVIAAELAKMKKDGRWAAAVAKVMEF